MTTFARLDRIPGPAALLAIAALGVVVWISAPVLGPTPLAAIPMPTHGIALAILLAASARDRPALAVALWVAVAVGAVLAGRDVVRSLAGASMLVSQSIVIVVLYERFVAESPMDSVGALGRFCVAVLLGSVPVALTASAVIALTGVADDYSWLARWSAASTSCMIFVPTLLAFDGDRAQDPAAAPLFSGEFTLLLASFAVVLVDVFYGLGIGFNRIPHAVTTLPFLGWAALRFGVRGTAVASLLLVAVTSIATVAGRGAYMGFGSTLPERLLVAGYFMASVIGSVMLFAVGIRQRAMALRRARAAYAQLRAIVEGAGEMIAAIDADMTIVAANPSWVAGFEKVSGVVARTGMPMPQALGAVPRDGVAAVARWRRALVGESFVHRGEFGNPAHSREEFEMTYSPVRDEDGSVVGACQVVRNVTERRRREAEEGEARRLESIGRLAGGVAHDFNNLMAAVIGYSDLVAGTLPPDDPRRADLGEIERAAARAGELTQQLLAFARRRVIEPRLVDPGALVAGFCRLLAPLLGPNIVLVVRSAPDLALVRVDPTQFEQVVMNLAINARDAMGGAGRLLIETVNDERDGKPVVLLSVRDTGAGMTPEVQARMFEPFFTTKPLGEGTGLGLPTVHGIVHQALGQIDVESAPGVGTTFRIYFPAALTQAPDAPPRPAPHTP
ncbi:MAG: ATP-binding protein [Gemmatimonadaceae bacterium]